MYLAYGLMTITNEQSELGMGNDDDDDDTFYNVFTRKKSSN